MIDLSQTLKKGTLLIVETGEYSDRSWSDPVRVLKDVLKANLVEEFKRKWKKPKDGWRDTPSPDDFLPWLVKTGYVEFVDNVHSWHVGSYGEFEP